MYCCSTCQTFMPIAMLIFCFLFAAGNSIAGRHLLRISKLGSEDLKIYGMNLADLLDLCDLVQEFIRKPKESVIEESVSKHNSKDQQTENASLARKSLAGSGSSVGSDASSICPDEVDLAEGSMSTDKSICGSRSSNPAKRTSVACGSKSDTGAGNINLNKSSHPSTSSSSCDYRSGLSDLEEITCSESNDTLNKTTSEPKTKRLIQSKGVFSDSESSKSEDDIDSDYKVNSDDEVFKSFATRQEVRRLKHYERYAFKSKIEQYNNLKQEGHHTTFTRPSVTQLYSNPSKEKSKGNTRTKKKPKESDDQGPSSHTKSTGETSKRIRSDSGESDDLGHSSHRKRTNKTSRRIRLDSEADSDDLGHSSQKKRRSKTSKRVQTDSEEENGNTSKQKKKLKRMSSKRSKRADKDVSRDEIMEEHKAFLSDDDLRVTDKKEIKIFLRNKFSPKYSILNILACESKTDPAVAEIEATLKSKGAVYGADLTKLISTLLEHLYAQTKNPSMVSADKREGLAVCLVATFPKMGHEPLTPEEKPWSWIYDRKHNKGKFANYHAHKQKSSGEPRLRGGGGSKPKKSKEKVVVEQVVRYASLDDIGLSKDARYLRLLGPDDRNKPEICSLMEKTFADRRKLVYDPRSSVRLLLQAYPQLKNFEGRMIDDEFEQMFPGKGCMLIKNYCDLVPKLIKIAQANKVKFPPEKCLKFDDSGMNSLIILSLYLPKPKRVESNAWEMSMEPLPNLRDFFEVIPSDADMSAYIIERRERDSAPVQPYILAKGTHKKIESIALVLGDSEYINLPRSTMPLRAVDLLVKANYVLGTHFYLGWKYVFRFLVANIYKMQLENPRHSAFTEQYRAIMGI